ncbi:hypothetical protein HPP92_001175 [Vanilla planifolia]|uniref:MADS-box domain-containing protein n=2 Tax=Vanilla planifolia TaxID=51239 RepID=A0A835RVS9_VANPL|nr:hypothetical protein HPP92_001175 [Vanilla planifolia]
MARKKVSLSLIANEATRRATLKKRRKGLMKKVKELSILCDVRACAIVYSPQEAQPEVWPSVAEATRLLTRFRSMPEMEQSKKMLNQETFLRQRVAKLHEQLRRHERENRELESAALLRECLAASGGGSPFLRLRIEELASLSWLLDQKVRAVQERIDELRSAGDAKMVECFVPPPQMLPPTLTLLPLPPQTPLPMPMPMPMVPMGSVAREEKFGGRGYHEAMRWFGGDDAAAAVGTAVGGGEQSYQHVRQFGEEVDGACGGLGAEADNVLAAAAFVEQNQNSWENLFPPY